PADGPQDNMTLKMPTSEWVHVLLLQLNSGISLPSQDLCNSAKKFTSSSSFSPLDQKFCLSSVI
ncbi:hypothetical protein, partial [Klebsiella variicola]